MRRRVCRMRRAAISSARPDRAGSTFRADHERRRVAHCFVFEPHEQLAAEQAIDAAGEQVIGIAHSHPTGESTPSAVDVADAGRFDPFGILSTS